MVYAKINPVAIPFLQRAEERFIGNINRNNISPLIAYHIGIAYKIAILFGNLVGANNLYALIKHFKRIKERKARAKGIAIGRSMGYDYKIIVAF